MNLTTLFNSPTLLPSHTTKMSNKTQKAHSHPSEYPLTVLAE